MPYRVQKKGILLPPELDRRVKLLDSDKTEIKRLYEEGATIRGLTRQYKVSRRLIQFIIFPERQKKNLSDRKIRGGSKQYYKGGKEWSETMKEHRRYKHETLKDTVASYSYKTHKGNIKTITYRTNMSKLKKVKRGAKKGTKHIASHSKSCLYALFSYEKAPKYVGMFINATHAAKHIQDATGINTHGSSIQKYVSYKIHSLQGFIAIQVDLKGNPLDGIPKELIEQATVAALLRKRRDDLAHLTAATILNLSESQVERIVAIINETTELKTYGQAAKEVSLVDKKSLTKNTK